MRHVSISLDKMGLDYMKREDTPKSGGAVYTLVYSFQEITILYEGVPAITREDYRHCVVHIACIQQGHARRDAITSV